MDLRPNDTELAAVLSGFARTMVMEPKIQAILDQLVRRSSEILPVASVGITLSWSDDEPELMAGSNQAALSFELLQSILDEGPRLVSCETGRPVSIPDLRSADRFPAFGCQAVADGLAAVFSFPLLDGRDLVGSFDLYRDTPGPLDAHSAKVAQMLADVAVAYLTNARTRTDLEESSARARQRSLHDGLTGLPNRALLLERLEHAFLRARRSRNLTAILFCDLDKFKRVNDVFGHRVGDELLVAVADRLTKQLRPGDTLARLAGDEFVLVLEDVSESEVGVIAERMDAAFSEPFQLSCGEVRTKASIGIAFAGRGNERPVKVLEKADLAMYRAKRDGGGTHYVIGHDDQEVRVQRGEEGRKRRF